MDFKAALTYITRSFARGRVRYAVIGGVAVGVHAAPRATGDVDLLVHADDVAKAGQLLSAFGWMRFRRNARFSRYTGVMELGTVDLQHGSQPYALRMLRDARQRVLAFGRLRAPVVSREDLIGLKAQACANNSARRAQDRTDILAIVRRHRRHLDWTKLRYYFRALKMEREFENLRSGRGMWG